MAQKKKKKIALPPETVHEEYAQMMAPIEPHAPSRGFFSKYKLVLPAALLLLLGGLFLVNKGLLLAAVVNGRPIFRWDLNRVMASRFGDQTLENMINEQLIAEAAKKSGITVTQQDIDDKENELVKTLGDNVKLDDLLKYQGMSKSDFDDQIRLQLTVQRVLGKDITITDSDITNFIATSGSELRATDPAALNEEARQAILEKKIGEKIQPWFLELKQNAKVTKFL